jgi:uncharacterized protein
MRLTALFFAYLLACLLAAALLTPPLLASGWITLEPQRVLSRLAQVLMVLGIWPLLHVLALANRTALGYSVSGRDWHRSLIGGWLLGAAMILVLTHVLLALELRLPAPPPLEWLELGRKLAQVLVSGVLIALIEETFFRGAVYSAIRRRAGVRTAVLGSAGLYAAVHFLNPNLLPTAQPFDHAAALTLVGHTFTAALDWRHLDSFIALLLGGMLLALVRERSGHLGWCLGIHAGWVFVIQITRWLTDGNPTATWAFLVGDYDGMIGWLAALWLALLTAGLWWRSAKRIG